MLLNQLILPLKCNMPKRTKNSEKYFCKVIVRRLCQLQLAVGNLNAKLFLRRPYINSNLASKRHFNLLSTSTALISKIVSAIKPKIFNMRTILYELYSETWMTEDRSGREKFLQNLLINRKAGSPE